MMATGVAPLPQPPSVTGHHGVTLLAGAWVVLGVFVDGWAHINRSGFETFFTPWHALLYSGAAVLFGWLLLPGRPVTRRDRVWAVAAASIFAVGGAGDLLWHQVFGVETGLDALVSPTHLLLLAGGLLGITAPLRESRGPRPAGLSAALPGLGAVTLAAALTAFFLLYVSPFTTDAPTLVLTSIPEGAPGHGEAEAPAVVGLAGYLVTTALVVVPLLWLRTHRKLPFGGITLLVTTIATLSAAVTQFEQPLAPLAALVAGVAADVVARAAERVPTPAQLPLVGAAVPVLLWSAQLTALALTEGVRWPAELVLGAPILSAMLGAALGVLARPSAPSSRHGGVA